MHLRIPIVTRPTTLGDRSHGDVEGGIARPARFSRREPGNWIAACRRALACEKVGTRLISRETCTMKTRFAKNIRHLRDKTQGIIVLPGDAAYDEARRVWNAMIDRRPGVIARCLDEEDVATAITFACSSGMEIAVRGGGHNIAGFGVCDNGLVIDLSRMKGVAVNPQARRAYVQPGATLHDFDEAVQAHALATPVGVNSTTGIAGLTLGGGFGWLTREYGMTIDNLVSAEVVTADGKRLKASNGQNADLFWAIRGGGGNFGVVTQFEFQLHPVGPDVLAGLIVYPLTQAKQVLKRYRQFVESAPVELNVWALLSHAPPLPFLPEKVHGTQILALAVFYPGEVSQGNKLIAPLLAFGDVLGEHVAALPYLEWQQIFDQTDAAGARNYWKSHNLTELSDAVVDVLIDSAASMPSRQCQVLLGMIAGAANQVPPHTTAYSARETRFIVGVHSRWEDPTQDDRCVAWARAFFGASAPYASAGAYVNFMTAEEGERVAAAYGTNYARLVQIKKKYDPENLFHFNHNIRPGEATKAHTRRTA
jgi:FAD/FMN-containing dehydrogenase